MPLDMSQVSALGGRLKSSGAPVRREAGKAVRKSTKAVENDAKARAHVLSGELRDSITSRVSGTTGLVESDSDHAAYNEYGTSRMAPIPFMGPALDQEEPRFAKGLEDGAGRAIEQTL